ncbi:SpoIIE family protein phosphatase [Streptomyces sp. GC420]|uniref:SpoIIE family protein phosphatase n=1 Tax=Streptomyces sp. GC420 TaxID=2697568 RepID=UPI0014151D3A|nr:SpoIIE family protein phosphatase [Streptomyces sp. GC420]NBM19744.1 SpoIIE family protein phosphatase [Streptomyces sp. GC420]
MSAERQAPAVPGTTGVGRAEGLPFHAPTLAGARAVARTAALVAATLGAVGLAGWILGSEVLKSVLPGEGATMKPNTAVGLLALGLSLFVVAGGPMSRRTAAAARAAAAVATLIGTLTAVEYFTGTGLGIDELLFEDENPPVETTTPGRMAPNTALGLMLGGAAALCGSGRRLPAWTGQIPALAVLTLGMLRIYGFAYDVPQLDRFGDYTGMALHTALALVLLGVAAFLVRPGEGPAGLLTNAGTTGALGRRMITATLVVPPLLGWIVLAGEDAGLYDIRLAIALLVCGHVTVFAVVGFAALTVGRRIEMAHARAEWQVRQNRLVQDFMDHTPAVVFIKDLDGRYLAVNTTFEESMGLSRERVLGHRDQELPAPETARQVCAADLEMLAGGRVVQREERLGMPDGPRDFLTTLFLLNDPSGEPYAVCGVATDVTERVAAQREVQRANRRFLALLESAPDATLITDGKGTVVMANAQVEPLFGRAPADLVGTSVHDLVPGPRRRHHAALLGAYLRQPDPRPTVLDRGLCGLRGDGSEFPAEVSVSTFQAEQDTLVFLTVRDITDRRRAEAERAERYEQHRRIAYTLQHSLMGEPPRLPYLPSAHRYLASVQDPGVGGDWFDIIPLDEARTGIVIGDVMGRGLEAAAVMGQLRAAAHALARTNMPPGRLMTGLDAFVSDLADQLVTCCYLLINQKAHEVTLCSAGHLPVIAMPPGGPAHRLPAPVNVPLGVNGPDGGVPYLQATRPLPPGSTLALYTDGLVERPGTDLDTQIDLLTHALGAAIEHSPADPDVLDRAAARLVGALIPDTAAHDDDVTLLLIGLPERDAGHAGRAAHAGPAAHRDTAHRDTAHRDTAHRDTAHRDTAHRDTAHRG